jgi:hypothetical protein
MEHCITRLASLTSSAIMPLAEAVTPPPDGGYSNLCTAEGFGAPEAQTIEIAQLKSDLAEQRRNLGASMARKDKAIAVLTAQLQQVIAQFTPAN